MRKDLVIF